MQLNKLVLDKNIEQIVLKFFKNKMSHENFCMHLTLLKKFSFSSKDALIYIEIWLLVISETDNFLQLEISLFEEILSRSSLLVTTEIEVYAIVDKWINHDFKEREKFAKRLLHKIRLPLLAEKTLKTILSKKSCFRKNEKPHVVVDEILNGNFNLYRNKRSKFITARCCGHDSFDILYLGSYEKTTNFDDKKVNDKILRIQYSHDFDSSEVNSSLMKKRYHSKVVYLRGNVYIFDGYVERNNIVKEVEVYSHLWGCTKFTHFKKFLI